MRSPTLAALCFFSCLLCVAIGQNGNPPFKAVNLGSWLVTESWMNPSLFKDIPNNDLLDGNQVQFKSTKLNMYLSSESGGGTVLVANRSIASDWETFKLWRIDESTFNFRVFNGQFVGLDSQGSSVVAVSNEAGTPQTFQILRKSDDLLRVRIKASTGCFLQANTESSVTADYDGSTSDWGDQDPSVFTMAIVKQLGGEYQVTNGYGPDKAPQIMREHWNSYIVEDDFKFMSENGLNAVRIPVGWWIKYDQNPPKPFVGGSLQALDNAFNWAQTYNMKVIVDLHAAPGSQNGNGHSGTRDGSLEWGDSRIDETVSVIDFLAQRYASDQSLGAIELINEPQAPGVSFDTLSKYYQAGYAAVRKYTQSAYVILSNRLGPKVDNKELLPLARSFSRSVIDVHYYNLFSDNFKSMNVQQNINYIYNDRASQLREVTPSDGPLSFVGEWTAEWALQGASNEDYQRFARAQLKVYGRATFGWAYWSYKNSNYHWSLRQMIQTNLINVNS